MSFTTPPLRGSHDAAGSNVSSHVSQLIMQLVGRIVPAEKSDQLKLSQYVLRILGSRLPPSPINDEYALVSLMKKNCTPDPSQNELAPCKFWQALMSSNEGIRSILTG
jgi:hypothetical protein